MKSQCKKIFSIGIIVSMILTPVYGYSFDPMGSQIENLSLDIFSERPLMGAVYFRSDGTACGFVESDELQSAAFSSVGVVSERNIIQSEAKERFREGLVRRDIPACDSSEDLKTIEQVVQGFQGSVQVAATSTLLLSGLGVAVGSSAGACVFGGVSAYYKEKLGKFNLSRVLFSGNFEGGLAKNPQELTKDEKFKFGLFELISDLAQVAFIVGGMAVTGAKVWKTGAVKGSFAGILAGSAASWAAFECAEFVYLVY